jgi:vitamin B12 transporter
VNNSLAAGVDFDYIDNNTPSNYSTQDVFSRITFQSNKWGIFLNDTLLLKNIAISPGIRYDRMNPVGDFFSPSLGIAWNLTEKITLRGYAAYGYSLPLILPGQPQEKVLTFQTGFETTHIPWLWLKTTFFRNQLSDVQDYDDTGAPILTKKLKQGVEVEVKTLPIFNTSISAGYTFIDISNRDTGEILKDRPRNLVKLGLHYNDDRHSFRGTLLGRYVDWNATTDSNARYSAVIWDLNLAKKVFTVNHTALELFFNAHNLFNGAQYPDGTFKNARRWVESGIRFNF